MTLSDLRPSQRARRKQAITSRVDSLARLNRGIPLTRPQPLRQVAEVLQHDWGFSLRFTPSDTSADDQEAA